LGRIDCPAGGMGFDGRAGGFVGDSGRCGGAVDRLAEVGELGGGRVDLGEELGVGFGRDEV